MMGFEFGKLTAKDAKDAKKELGISPAKALRRKGFGKKFFPELSAFAPWREQHPNPNLARLASWREMRYEKIWLTESEYEEDGKAN